jgi:hypothetical protein
VDRRAALADVLRELQEQHGPLAVSKGMPPRAVSARPDADALPPWWGDRIAEGHRLVELAGPASCGKLSLALLWLTAADHGGIVAVVDTAGTFYPPSAALAGLDLDRVVFVHPPDEREAAHAVTLLVGSAGFDAVLWPLTPRTRPGGPLAMRLAQDAARAGTRLLTLLERPHSAAWWGLSSADVRLAISQHEWQIIDGELGGVDLTIRTERARGMTVPDWRFELRSGPEGVKIAASGVRQARGPGIDVREATASRVAAVAT